MRCLSLPWLLLALPCAAGPFDAAAPVSAGRLDRARGGFTTPEGLTVTLGIERLVSINGATVARNSVQLGDLARLDGAQAAAARAALAGVQLVQNGPNNAVLAQLPDTAAGGIVIQNTLNDQVVRTQTLINTSVNSASLLKSLNLAASLADAVNGGLAPR